MYSICYGNSEISFDLIRKDVKNINLRVKPNLEVSVSANEDVPLDYIKKFVYSKAEWIEKNLDYYEKLKPVEVNKKDYVSGECFRYLGKQYRLKVFQSEDETVKYYRGYIHLFIKNLNDKKRKEVLIENWYKQRSKIIFSESLDRMYNLIRLYDIAFPRLEFRKMKSRWGTCYYKNNKIVLNSVLIKAPKDCIDYVVLHELIHFIHHKHDNDFYKLLNVLMADWKDKKKILDEVVAKELS